MTPQKVVIFKNHDQSLILYPALFQTLVPAEELEQSYWISEIPWQQNTIQVFGKQHNEPRLTFWMGPRYKYSSIEWPSTPFLPLIEQVNSELCDLLDFPFNSCLLNYYRNGQDSMGRHRDNEPEMDTRVIASLSLGGSRKIKFRHTNGIQKLDVILQHGDLLIMKNFQEDWYHELPKVKNALPRLNLTFRRIKT